MSEAMARQLGNFIGSFIQYDAKAIVDGVRGYMRIRIKLDVRVPLRRKKKIMVNTNKHVYAQFQYEHLSLFCFLCGHLGHGEGFCPIRAIKGKQKLVAESGVFLLEVSRRAEGAKSCWLCDEKEKQVPNIIKFDTIAANTTRIN